MNYEQMSDEEINHQVLKAIYGDVVDYWSLSECGKYLYDCGPIGDDFNAIELKDYCNNPADAWPVIVDNGITMINEGQEWSALANASVSSGWGVSFDHVCWHVNPLRAAMIVFMMMKEAK